MTDTDRAIREAAEIAVLQKFFLTNDYE